MTRDPSRWDPDVLAVLGVPLEMLPTIVDSSGIVGAASALPGAPPIVALIGDQQASLVGQGCVRPGDAKITFGTGGMLDLVLGEQPPAFDQRGPAGTFPIVAWRRKNVTSWGLEAIMLAAGTNVQWLRDDLGLIATVGRVRRGRGRVHRHRRRCLRACVARARHSGVGLRRARCASSDSPAEPDGAEIVRAVLEGVAHRGADLVESAEADSGVDDSFATRRRRHDRQQHVRAGARRRLAETGRDLADARGDVARRGA